MSLIPPVSAALNQSYDELWWPRICRLFSSSRRNLVTSVSLRCRVSATIFSPFSQTSNRLSHRKAISARLAFFSGVKSLNAWNLTLPFGQTNFASGKFSSFGRSNSASASLAGNIHFVPSAGVRYVFVYCFMMSPIKETLI